ncbi:hypothetical protein ACTGY1_10225, partial [Streptococcus suis]
MNTASIRGRRLSSVPVTALTVTALAATLALSACGDGSAKDKGARGANQGPVTVGYVVVQPSDAAMVTELAGRT